MGKSYGMRRIVSFFGALLTVLSMAAQSNIAAIDVHSHIVTDEYLKYLAHNNALMEDSAYS